MDRKRVIAIGLDGLELSLAERLMAAGEMPMLAALRDRSARFRLDHGPAQRTGLAWEHVASGLSPEAAHRWAAVEFDPATYDAWQEGARFTPWWADMGFRVVVFDAPYVDLGRTRNTHGIVGWGAHDPGVTFTGRPRKLASEYEQKFGLYPASRWTYGIPWPSPKGTREMGEALDRALDVRRRAAGWLARERLPDWDLFIAVAGEMHGTIEGLWHGVDPNHPLSAHPSATDAAWAVRRVHHALDRLVGELASVDRNASIVAFAMGGMGPNNSDVPSMVLLPELLYRHAFGESCLNVPGDWTSAQSGLPLPNEESDWSAAIGALMPGHPNDTVKPSFHGLRAIARRLPHPVKGALRRARAAMSDHLPRIGPMARHDLHWQPALRYRRHWPKMAAFALPSFYDGRIRVNLRGRERIGIVETSRYEETLQSLERLLRECRNPLTGEPVVESFERASTRNPLMLGGSEADLLVIWRNVTAALEHPRHGLVGPVPLRRTGGHTGPHGLAYVAAPGVSPGDRGVRSSFDVVPTIASLLGQSPHRRVSGQSLI
jgi:predicted AlkP superfamily phosphohydrolase/phosphomutase